MYGHRVEHPNNEGGVEYRLTGALTHAFIGVFSVAQLVLTASIFDFVVNYGKFYTLPERVQLLDWREAPLFYAVALLSVLSAVARTWRWSEVSSTWSDMEQSTMSEPASEAALEHKKQAIMSIGRMEQRPALVETRGRVERVLDLIQERPRWYNAANRAVALCKLQYQTWQLVSPLATVICAVLAGRNAFNLCRFAYRSEPIAFQQASRWYFVRLCAATVIWIAMATLQTIIALPLLSKKVRCKRQRRKMYRAISFLA